MKRLFAILFSFFFIQPLLALPLMNPLDASLYTSGVLFGPACTVNSCTPWFFEWTLRAGLYEDYIPNRKLRIDEDFRKKTIHETRLRTDAAFLALNIYDLFDLFATVGRTRIEVTTPRSAWALVPQGNQFTFLPEDPSFSWSAGGRVTLWQWRCFGLGLEGQYFWTRPRINSFRAESIVIEVPEGNFKYQEWQVGLGAAYKIRLLADASGIVPYLGIKWSDVRTTTGHIHDVPGGADEFFDLTNQRHFGYAAGFSFIWHGCVGITVEARFLDETAYHVNAQVAF